MDQSSRPQTSNRRSLFIGAGAVAAAWLGWPRLMDAVSGGIRYVPLAGVPGYRLANVGATSGGIDPLLGVSDGSQPLATDTARRRVAEDLCGVLHRGATSSALPVAAFSDYNCPFCRVLTQKLADRAETLDLHLTWHEWPILGPTSVTAAKAALAADLQGQYAAFHKRLMRSRLVVEPRVLAELARDIGADPNRFVADYGGSVVAHQLALSDAAARRLRLPGTPAMVMGRTVVIGAVTDADLERLIEEARIDWPGGCSLA